MYRLKSLEKLRFTGLPSSHQVSRVSPVVWKLGLTSFLTDISSEMVNSALPVYLVLHLHLSPLQYGAIDGVYTGTHLLALALHARSWHGNASRVFASSRPLLCRNRGFAYGDGQYRNSTGTADQRSGSPCDCNRPG